MKIEYLEERVKAYHTSLNRILEKRKDWNERCKPLLLETLELICTTYPIGWEKQHLHWLDSAESVNITIISLPSGFQKEFLPESDTGFITGSALVFTQAPQGDVWVFMAFPASGAGNTEPYTEDLGYFAPQQFTEEFVIELADGFLKRLMEWESPHRIKSIGFTKSNTHA